MWFITILWSCESASLLTAVCQTLKEAICAICWQHLLPLVAFGASCPLDTEKSTMMARQRRCCASPLPNTRYRDDKYVHSCAQRHAYRRITIRQTMMMTICHHHPPARSAPPTAARHGHTSHSTITTSNRRCASAIRTSSCCAARHPPRAASAPTAPANPPLQPCSHAAQGGTSHPCIHAASAPPSACLEARSPRPAGACPPLPSMMCYIRHSMPFDTRAPTRIARATPSTHQSHQLASGLHRRPVVRPPLPDAPHAPHPRAHPPPHRLPRRHRSHQNSRRGCGKPSSNEWQQHAHPCAAR